MLLHSCFELPRVLQKLNLSFALSTEYIKLAANASKVASEVVNWDSQHVVDGMQQAVVTKSPPARILVGGDAKYVLILIRMLPTWISSRLLSLKTMRLTRVAQKSKNY